VWSIYNKIETSEIMYIRHFELLYSLDKNIECPHFGTLGKNYYPKEGEVYGESPKVKKVQAKLVGPGELEKDKNDLEKVQ
jgi:hypothetical protein